MHHCFTWNIFSRIITLIACTSSAILSDHKMDMTGRWTSYPLSLWHCPLLLGKRPGSGAQFASVGNTAEATPDSLGCSWLCLPQLHAGQTDICMSLGKCKWARGHKILFVADPGWFGLCGGAGWAHVAAHGLILRDALEGAGQSWAGPH